VCGAWAAAAKLAVQILEYYMQNAIAPYVEPRDEMSFQTETLLHIGERIFISSAPWQQFAMDVRDIYLYKDPWRTFKCLLAYLFLIKTGFMMTSMVGTFQSIAYHTDTGIVC